MAESNRKLGFTVQWKIPNAIAKCDTNYHTYDFLLAGARDTAWRLGVIVDTDLVCVWIKRLDDGGPGKVFIDCEFDLLLLHQEPVAPTSLRGTAPAKVQKKIFEREGCSEDVYIVQRSKIEVLKDEDVLLLYCRIWPRYSSASRHPVRHIVRSNEGCLECFIWTVSDFSSFQRGDRTHYVLKKNNNYSDTLKFDLFLGEDNDTLCIKQTTNEKYFLISIVSVLNGKGENTVCLKNFSPFDEAGYPITIPLEMYKSTLLQDMEKFLPNDQLTLSFNVRRCTSQGVLEKIMIGDSGVDDEIAALNSFNVFNKERTDNLTHTTSPTTSTISLSEDLPSSNAANHLTLSKTSMASDLYHLLEEGTLTDCELRIGSDTVRVHKNILAARSPVFLDKLTNGCDAVDMQDLEMDTMKQLLDFMYLDSVPDLDCVSAIKLYKAAREYQVVGLRKKCSEILKSKFSVQSVCPILSVADTHNDKELKQCVEKFILQNWNSVVSSQEWDNFTKENMSLSLTVMQKIRI